MYRVVALAFLLSLIVSGTVNAYEESPNCALFTDEQWNGWGDLIDFKLPESVLSAANASKWVWQRIDDGKGSLVNLDRYEIEVVRMPRKEGKVLTSENLLEWIRTELEAFLYPRGRFEGNESPPKTSFYARDNGNQSLWNSGTVGAQLVFGMRFPAMPVTLSAADLSIPAHVLLAERSNQHWRFVTGNHESPPHPVSGVREFGFKIEDNKTIIYTRGADRISSWAYQADVTSDMVFRGGEDLWVSFQQNVARYVRTHGGEANIRDPYSIRYCWEGVKPYRGKPISPKPRTTLPNAPGHYTVQ